MSGTSVDGLDVAFCQFVEDEGNWEYDLHQATTYAYPPQLRSKLMRLTSISPQELIAMDLELGIWMGVKVRQFVEKHKINPILIGSHGHTVFHQPENGFSLQIGNGNALYNETRIPVICDFRLLDILKGGQGAPLVPVGDRHLFWDYSFCLNIGGIANISYESGGNRLAYDICPANMVLNFLAQKIGLEYDQDGTVGRKGSLLNDLKEDLNKLPYYRSQPPKSLGSEWVWGHIVPLLERKTNQAEDLLHTLCHHIAHQITRAVEMAIEKNAAGPKKILVTGGGAFNTFLMDLIDDQLPKHFSLVTPSNQLISFKEALVFAFLAVLRIRGEVNCLSSVTGANSDSSAGMICGLPDFDFPPVRP